MIIHTNFKKRYVPFANMNAGIIQKHRIALLGMRCSLSNRFPPLALSSSGEGLMKLLSSLSQ